MEEIIKTHQLYRSYEKISAKKEINDSVQVLKGIDLTVNHGEFVGIMGKSGCGKTTLIKTLGLIDEPTKGNLYFKGKDTKDLWVDELADIRRREIGFVFQDFYLMDSLSVKENIMLPMILDKREAEQCIGKAEKLAEQFGLTKLLKKNPYELSGGEKQRAAICRALINNPDLILADEPTGNLDSKSGKVVMDEFIKINEEMKKTVIMVTHDPKMASLCKRIIFLKDGVILEDIRRTGDSEAFYQEVLDRMAEL
ncbi:MAG: ABC transporter ATP-binding protein [Lachnospiraceae bacterium]